ncbi:toxin-antitoxin system toxin subunit [Streptomyces noursei ZPM]|uniref:Toxin n=2 Tax=Streptomyces noursei TaxID=1971 RepID=A0A059W4Y4_STRNR|nr:DUF397 domain-containing protein [Streptomyces noursei]AKA05061.1 toxin-antitoxin system toxin subunit [Streptomyces noursei ZPM]EOT03426.1 hypothetical protein K530_13651 [Streptomyces noursei CCRC 11814]AIA04865.1 hypothetical protein DC74_4385 [Streptomyces noursei]EXU88052.1 hypothetical protein P354_31855 [Streptomyces noursei PD-1]MCZ0974101.1 DUF397 domain-containing protein [Streptomyces noursei]
MGSVRWRKSSYSNGMENCVEVADDVSADWGKSSYSGSDGGQCVEISPSFASAEVIPVRDSKVPQGPTLVFPADGWASFVSAVRHGEFVAF